MSLTTGQIPKPFGKKVSKKQWKQVFSKVRKFSPHMTFYDGFEQVASEMLAYRTRGRKEHFLIVDEVRQTFTDRLKRKGSMPLLRAQYYEGGLQHRLSMTVQYAGNMTFEKYPANVFRIESAIHRVSNLFVSYPSDDKPVLLEIPVEGAPPEVRVLELSIESMKAYSPKTSKLLPKAHKIRGMNVQFVDLGEALVDATIEPIGDDMLSFKLDSLSKEASALYDNYLEDEYVQKFKGKKAGKTNGQQAAAGAVADKKDALPDKDYAVVVVKDLETRAKLTQILDDLEFTCLEFSSYEDEDLQKYLNKTRLFVLESPLNGIHPVQLLRKWVNEERILPSRFIIVGQKLEEAREHEWHGIGQGIFLRQTIPIEWMKTKLMKWLEIKSSVDTSEKADTSRPLVLLVDKHTDHLDTMASLLIRNNCRVATADDRVRTVQAARNLRPRLIVIDHDIFGAGLIEVLRTLRAFHATRQIPVMIISWKEGPMEPYEDQRLNISTFHAFPFEENTFVQRLDQILER
ncbi:response regulator [bacterium]|nr:response regulator [bacterium]